MSRRKTVLVVALILLLALNLAAINGVVAAERSVLDRSFVKSSLEEEGAYRAAQTLVVDSAAQNMDDDTDRTLPVSTDTVVSKAVTAEYVEQQSEANIDRAYLYLHGKRNDLGVSLNLSPVKENTADAVEAELREAEFSEILEVASTTEASRFDLGGDTIELSTIATMADNRTAYRTAKRSFRNDLRERVVSQAVEQTYSAASNDELLSLVVGGYDPSAHSSAEKESMVETRENEIRSALRGRIKEERAEEIEARVNDSMARLRTEAATRTETQVAESGLDPRLAASAAGVIQVGVEGLTTAQPYDEFHADLDRAKGRLAANASVVVQEEFAGEIPDRVGLAEAMGPDAEQGLEQARQVVGIVDLLAVLLPLLALLLVGLLWYVTRAPMIVTFGLGTALLVAGLAGVGGVTLVSAQIDGALSSADVPQGLLAVVLGLAEQVLAVVRTQSIGLAGIGVGFVGIGVVSRVVDPNGSDG